ncbi:MAG: hypothetical protein K1X74_16705 [Pirellulales bacterium]|nr:hypothetical protein [Pirellulales bacterium]
MDARNLTGVELLRQRPALRRLFAELLKAHEYAEFEQVDRWEYGVPLEYVKTLGVTDTDLRFLCRERWIGGHRASRVSGEFAGTAVENTDEDGSPEVLLSLLFSGKQAVVLLTSIGVQLALELHTKRTATVSRRVQRRPHYNCELRELWCVGQLIKRFREPAENQHRVLAAFEEEGWPLRIDDPLPQAPNISPRARLADTIKSLNRKHEVQLVRFFGDGRGEGVRWEFCAIVGR